MRTSSKLPFTGRRKLNRIVDITPLIDVVFQLLLFFMLTSAMVATQGLDLTLPEANSLENISKDPIQIEIPAEGPLLVNFQNETAAQNNSTNKGTLISDDKLPDILSSQNENLSDREVVIRSDSSVPVKRLVLVLDILREHGLSKLSIAADPRTQ
ncbi:MAG TPA: biopolymer transporter ExbD [Oligoflexia bacterium]|nr:biopolymer transporter ExbD [Oligoflexia bacterium]HMP48876.1 biopolymer transporter ExbD [Oligoflexia bacterium]